MILTRSVRAKLLAIVVMLSAVAIVLGVMGWKQMGSINDRLGVIVDRTSTAQVLATRVRVQLMAIHRAEKNLLLADTPELRNEYAAALETNVAELNTTLAELEQLCVGEDLDRITSFRNSFNKFNDISDQVVELARMDTNTRAAQLSATRSLELYLEAAAPIESIADLAENRANDLMTDIAADLDQAGKAKVRNAADASLAVQRSGHIVQDLLRIQRAEKNYILAKDAEEMAAYESEIVAATKAINDRTAALAPLLSDQGQAQLSAFTDKFNAWMTVSSEVRDLSNQATNTRAALLSKNEGRKHFDAAAEHMLVLSGNKDQDMVADKENADRAFASATLMMIIAATTGVTAATVIAFLLINKIVKTLMLVVSRMRAIAAGDLTGEAIAITSKDEIGQLAEATNEMQSSLVDMIHSITSNAEQVAAAATEVAATSEQMSATTDQQRSQVTQVAAAVEELSATITEVSGRTSDVSRQSTGAGQQATEGGEIVSRTVSEMEQISSQVDVTSTAVGNLSTKADQIGEILTVINDIADQTNLLALNAAIEAARAGEHGRGFAVVADEVRKLAERTQQATQEVSQSITEIQHSTVEATEMMSTSRQRVSSGVELAQQAGLSLESIVNGSNSVAQSIDSIAAAVEEQSATSAEIARAIEVISASADEASQGAGQAAAAATQLSGNAETLRELVVRFKVA